MNLAHEDDGIIDLRALKSTPPPRGAFPMASPFGSEPPPAAFALDAGSDSGVADVLPARASKAKTVGIAAGAALFLVLGAVGVGFAFRGAKPAKIASASVTQVAPPPVVEAKPAPAADPAPAPAAQSAASSADDTSAAADASSAKKTKGAKGRAAGASKAKTSAGTGVSSTPASKPAATKAADPCHCHGDFQCNIRCSANR
jgi:hypothetical protein